ncbi:hypothetical protein SAMN04488511_101530 [Pedobacter suwonensis]|uniref:Uncharacterized protein n=1 Tax=Pedobacter suwonensis TaxID=332999 RepID=A0A1I0SJX2_9SPHI|nr:hypothetical protein [Pedobacter suwonensis]SFA39809.1 hypothetical protein SAMN04488511_101530 [Pedobacter suwonensis]
MINYGFPFGYSTDGSNLQALQFGSVLLFKHQVKTHQQREVCCPKALSEFYERDLQGTAFLMMN